MIRYDLPIFTLSFIFIVFQFLFPIVDTSKLLLTRFDQGRGLICDSFWIVYNNLVVEMSKLGEDIINMYKPYRNHNAKWKVTTISKQRFEIYDKYEIIDVSMNYLMQSVRELMALSWPPKTKKN